MLKSAREKYNQSFTHEKYQQMLAEINSEFPGALDFRVAESPVFIDRNLKIKLLLGSNDVIDTIQKPNFKKITEDAIPSEYRFTNESEFPHFLAIDFALCKSAEGDIEPKLIEAQGFPSLFAYQSYISGKYKKHFDISPNLSPYFNRLNSFSFQQQMEHFIKGKDKENTVLLEVLPEKQKTRLDFDLSKEFWGIDTVGLSQLIIEGSKVFYNQEGEKKEIKRFYNRVILDDVEKNAPHLLPVIEQLKKTDVYWLSHPNWYYRVSKYMLPLIKSNYVPRSFYLNKIDYSNLDLKNYILKPLFSYAGQGVEIDINQKQLDAINNKEQFLLQEKVRYDPIVKDPKGEGVKAEIRLLFIWEEGKAKPQLMTTLCRLSKGLMVGVDHNKDYDWVGGSAAFTETN